VSRLVWIGPNAEVGVRSSVERNLRWNFSFGVADGAFFGLYLVFADVNFVLPWLLSQLTTAKWIIGLPPILMAVGGSLPQLAAAHLVQRHPSRRQVLLAFSTVRLVLLLLVLPFLFWPGGSPEVTLLGVLIPFALACLALSFVALPWNEMTAKTIPARRLSAYFGARTLISGILGLGASLFIGSYLGAVQTVPLPRFGIVIAIAAAGMGLSQAMNAFIREPLTPVPETIRPLASHALEAVRVSYRDRTYRYYLVTRALLMLSALAAPFFIVEGRNNYGLLAESIGTYTFASVAAGIAASLGWSLLGDRLGMANLTRIVAALSAAPALLALAMPALAATPLGVGGAWLIVFLLQGAAVTSQLNLNMRGMIEMPRSERRAQMIGAGNTFCGLVILGGPLVGLLADAAGSSAAFVFAVACTLPVIAIAGLFQRRPSIGDPVVAP
jgi:hypothetical protein